MRTQVSSKVLFAILGVASLIVLIAIGRWVLTPAPVIPNPAVEQEPTG